MAEVEKKTERKLPCTASVLAYPNCPFVPIQPHKWNQTSKPKGNRSGFSYSCNSSSALSKNGLNLVMLTMTSCFMMISAIAGHPSPWMRIGFMNT